MNVPNSNEQAVHRLVLERLRRLNKASGAEDVTRTSFAALGLDSLEWMSLASEIEELTGLMLPDEVLSEPKLRTAEVWAARLYDPFDKHYPTPGSAS